VGEWRDWSFLDAIPRGLDRLTVEMVVNARGVEDGIEGLGDVLYGKGLQTVRDRFEWREVQCDVEVRGASKGIGLRNWRWRFVVEIVARRNT
jgi:hypothetical protein